MISLPDDWNFSIVGLQKILPDGKDKVRTTLKTLEKKGYLQRNRICDEKGVVVDWKYCFSDEPLFLDSSEESSNTAQSDPQSENPNVDEKMALLALVWVENDNKRRCYGVW
ncbi:MAG: helix-turn-helix domain-containing protein [Oscillospiraceae bacterium]|nr:helix-turn-helix domain-containing protein [Oscillospiraceae bacterium]